MILLSLAFVVALLWWRGELSRRGEQDIERDLVGRMQGGTDSQAQVADAYADADAENERGYFVNSEVEREPLIPRQQETEKPNPRRIEKDTARDRRKEKAKARARERARPRAYTFHLYRAPPLRDYGTMVGVDATPETLALWGFYHFPPDNVAGGSSDSSSHSSYHSAREFASGSTATQPVSLGSWGMRLSTSPESLEVRPLSTSLESLRRVSPRPFEEDEGNGWTKWRWRLSNLAASISPTGTSMVV